MLAVAGAGCLAKYLNKLPKNGDGSSLLSLEDSNFENAESPTHPFCTQAGRDSLDRRGSDVSSQDCLLTIELASDREKVRPFRNCNESDALSVSNFNNIGYGNEQSPYVGGSCSFLLTDLSAAKLGHSPFGSKASHRTKHLYGHISGPSNSLESCLMAQLCKEHAQMDESVLSPSTMTRSFLVNDGNQMISRANDDDSFSGLTGSGEYMLHGEASKVKDESVLCAVPCLPKIGSSNDVKKMKFNAGSGRSKRLSPTSNVLSGRHIHTQHDETFLFSLGISFGIITSILANKREMDKLIELLKQTESLVQDLQQELEMKDSMRVKELHNENYDSQGTCDHSFCDKELNGFSPEKHTDNSPITDYKKSYDQKEEERSESMSKIEAELEAELERLGLNMNESSPERPLSELVELDPDFVADFAQGELQTDVIPGKDFVHSELNEDDSDTVVPVNYAVSPHELTLCLHEVIQSRLEGRVQELEIALENSQRKLRFMESEHESHPQKYFSSCGQASSLTKDDCEPITEPLVMSLFGDSPGAYIDTSYEEIIKIDDFEENSPSSIHISDYKVDSHSHDLHALGVQHCGANDLLTHSTDKEERLSRELSSGEVTMLEGLSSSNYELNDVTGDENCECDYEVERQLIRQIVERTKKGSPVFQNARRILYAMDED
ncbi:uncharacterized protein LOC114411803 isoform X2 [Glycine soja]|uniref:uncharacterized protein isoform X2 n=1 Tax=Glycine max TaxID=3847 RepID=UPI0007192167|nr:uncharacterized protein LOC100776932 isoform X2 [Glycine max]XP_028231306.1 uncharacterized protein LOC114411803 isoform X2 [Glycine soja]|eukprot:XP_014630903.1 uncharacterized protein LOC100776932 isoform X2 [Glycine max]